MAQPRRQPAHPTSGGRTAHQHTAGLAVLAVATLLATCWRALDGADPALSPAAVAAFGWPAAARAYAGWPLQAAWPTKAAYFLRHLPQLIAHVHVLHW
jgi:hypothetical protein